MGGSGYAFDEQMGIETFFIVFGILVTKLPTRDRQRTQRTDRFNRNLIIYRRIRTSGLCIVIHQTIFSAKCPAVAVMIFYGYIREGHAVIVEETFGDFPTTNDFPSSSRKVRQDH